MEENADSSEQEVRDASCLTGTFFSSLSSSGDVAVLPLTEFSVTMTMTVSFLSQTIGRVTWLVNARDRLADYAFMSCSDEVHEVVLVFI